MNIFTYKITKNMNTNYIFFELNRHYHPCISYKKDIDIRSKLKSAEKLGIKFKELMIQYIKKTSIIFKNLKKSL